MTATTNTTHHSEEVQADLRARVTALIDDEGYSQAKCATEAGIAYGTFTGWYRGTYQGDNNRVAGEVARWLKTREDRKRTAATLPQAPGFVPTGTTARITSILQYAQVAPDIAVIAGDAGTSKTSTCEEYCRATPNAWHVVMEPSTASANAMLTEVCAALGVTEKRSTWLARAVGEHLRGRNSLLIIDEAQHLSLPALEQLRAIHDKHGIGMALVGNVSIYSRIDGGRTAQFAQLFSRVGMRLTRTRPSAQDVRALLGAWGITAEDAIDYLTAIAGKPGALRQMTKTIRLACVVAQAGGDGVTVDHLKAAYGRLAMDA